MKIIVEELHPALIMAFWSVLLYIIKNAGKDFHRAVNYLYYATVLTFPDTNKSFSLHKMPRKYRSTFILQK